MRRFSSRKPSPAMVIAFIALLAALSGSAIALPGKNTVDSGDIKKNAVRTQDIRNGNVTTKDVKNNNLRSNDVRNNTLTGNDVNEGSLGQVPSANSANTANSANSANTANTATNATRAGSAGSVDGRTPFLAKLSAGQSQTLATHGAVSLVAECLESGGNDVVRILAATSQNGAAMAGFDIYTGAPGDTLDSTTVADDRVLNELQTTNGTTLVSWNIDRGWVMAPDGRTLGLDFETTPLGLNYAGAECVTSGIVNASG